MSNSGEVVRDVEDFLLQPRVIPGEPQAESSRKAKERLKGARRKIADVQVVVVEKGRQTASRADDYVHERPWVSMGVAFAIGAVIGWALERK